MGLLITVVAIPLILYYAMARSMDYAGSLPGPLANTADWPRPVQDLYAELKTENDIAFDGFLLFGEPGEYSVQEAVFRIETTETVLQQIANRLDLVRVDQEQLAGWEDLVVSKASKEWWAKSVDVDHFMSQTMLDGEEGDLYVAVYDDANQKLYLVYEFNF